MKKNLCLILAMLVALSFVFAGCSNQETATQGDTTAENTFEITEGTLENTDLAGQTLYGKVTAIDGNVITLDIGTMSENKGMGGDSASMPEGQSGNGETPSMPEGESGNGEMPSMTEGESGQTPPEKPDGEASSDGSAPAMPEGQSGKGEMPSMPEGESGQTPPEKPDGEASSDGSAPAMPEGESGNGEAPEKPEGESSADGNTPSMPEGGIGGGFTSSDVSATLTLADATVLVKTEDGSEVSAEISEIETDTILEIVFDENGKISKVAITEESGMGGGNMGGAPGGQSSAPTEYEAVKTYSEDTTVENESISSTGSDENAVLVTDGKVTLNSVTVDRTSSDSTGGDNSSFYGVGAAVLATSGTLTVSDSTISTDSAGGAGVFAYGDSVVYVKNTNINTTQNTSGGIHAAGGGTLYADNCTATTQGESSAAIRSDRGGGTMKIDGGSYTSNGTGSPAVYCTAEISVNEAELVSTTSEAICIEGKNSLALYDCNLSGNMADNEQNDSTWTVIVYQSMSGDSEVGCGTFRMQGGTLTSGNGGLFYTTNTASHFILSDVEITKAEDSEYFLAVLGNKNARGWGSTGSNGAQCTFTAIDQNADGDILWDSISTLDFYLESGSVLTGAVKQDESYAGEGGDGYASLYIDSDSKWVVTADSTLTNLYNEGQIVDAEGNTVTVKGTDGTVLSQGTSEITVTVTSYSTTADFSGADTLTEF